MSESRERSTFTFSVILFVCSSWWGLRRLKRDKELQQQYPASQCGIQANLPPGEVGPRGLAALSPSQPYLEGFLRCMQDPCDPVSNPAGYIALCMAENKLMIDVLAERLMQPGTSTAAFSDSSVYSYNSFLGIPVARQAAAYFLAKRFLFPNTAQHISPQQALHHVSPAHVCLSAGGNAILNSLFFLLGQQGDACLIPAPYYAAFENSMSLVAQITPFAFQVANSAHGPTPNELDLAFMQAKSQGLNPKFLLLTNPNNPMGTIYQPATIRNAIEWCRKRKLHTIMDECYALSTHKKADHGFQSVLEVLDNKLNDDVHMVWSISKDFGASGLVSVYSTVKMNSSFKAWPT